MSDSEINKLCADAMGIDLVEDGPQSEPPETWLYRDPTGWNAYDPLHDDAQAMAIVKKFKLTIGYSEGWAARKDEIGELVSGAFHYPSLNRAICECVAKLSTRTVSS